MLKDPNTPREPAVKRAERRWKNHGVATRFKAKKAEAKASPQEPEKPLIIRTEKQKADNVTRFQNKFLKSIREMMEGRKKRNVELFLAINNQQRRRLLKEKLRRLEAQIAEREGAAK